MGCGVQCCRLLDAPFSNGVVSKNAHTAGGLRNCAELIPGVLRLKTFGSKSGERPDPDLLSGVREAC